MRVMELRGWRLEHLGPGRRPRPKPGPGQVLLRLLAASLNFRDHVMLRRGYGRRSGELPLVPLSDGVGEVVELGPGAARFHPGQRVLPAMNQLWLSGPFREAYWEGYLGGPRDGVMQEFMALDEAALVPVPPQLSDLEAATLPCAAVTAWSAVVEAGAARPGETVLVQGTGGVSLFALQFAKLVGARVIATTSSPEKARRLTRLGAEAVIDYRKEPQWGKAAHALTEEGVDLVIEVGGAETLAQSVRAARPEGRIALVGNLSGSRVAFDLPPAFMKWVRLLGIAVGSRDSFAAMARAIAASDLHPVVDPKVYGFSELPQALAALPQGRHFGKIVIDFGR